MQFEYKVVPAPIRGKKTRGVKSPADRFANTLSDLMNELAADGWEYLRADTLPSEERAGFTGKTTVFQNVLVFRREVAQTERAAQAAPETVETAKPALTPTRAEFATGEAAKAPRLPGASHAMPEHKVPGPNTRDVAAE
jgi:hypothetical protein